jgi:hypothetical protein
VSEAQARSQVRVYGVDIHDLHARRLVGALTAAGTPAALAAAKQVSGALDRRGSAGRLTPEMRDAILAIMRPPARAPQGVTKELYRALLQDQVARRDSPEL